MATVVANENLCCLSVTFWHRSIASASRFVFHAMGGFEGHDCPLLTFSPAWLHARRRIIDRRMRFSSGGRSSYPLKILKLRVHFMTRCPWSRRSPTIEFSVAHVINIQSASNFSHRRSHFFETLDTGAANFSHRQYQIGQAEVEELSDRALRIELDL
jgi:hypothetical protein